MSFANFPQMDSLKLKQIIQFYTDDIAAGQAYIHQLQKKNEQKVQMLISFNAQMSVLDPNYEYTELGIEKFIEKRIHELEIKWSMKVNKSCGEQMDYINEIVDRMVERKFEKEQKKADKNWIKHEKKIKDLEYLNKSLKEQIHSDETKDKLVEDKLVEEKLTEGKFVEEKLVKEKLVKEKLVDEKLVEGKFVEGEFVDEKLTEGEFVDEKKDEKKDEKETCLVIDKYSPSFEYDGDISKYILSNSDGTIQCKKCKKVYKKIGKCVYTHLKSCMGLNV